MRFSAEPTDPGYRNFLNAKDSGIVIFFNGKPVPPGTCITADSDTGDLTYLRFFKKRQEFRIVSKKGKVRIFHG